MIFTPHSSGLVTVRQNRTLSCLCTPAYVIYPEQVALLQMIPIWILLPGLSLDLTLPIFYRRCLYPFAPGFTFFSKERLFCSVPVAVFYIFVLFWFWFYGHSVSQKIVAKKILIEVLIN